MIRTCPARPHARYYGRERPATWARCPPAVSLRISIDQKIHPSAATNPILPGENEKFALVTDGLRSNSRLRDSLDCPYEALATRYNAIS
jgi:hypothetical protein